MLHKTTVDLFYTLHLDLLAEIKLKHFNSPLVVGCSVGHKSLLFGYFKKGKGQTFVSVVLSRSNHAVIC